MFLYLIIILLLLVCSKRKENWIVNLFTVILFLIAILRDYSVGTDTLNYLDYFRSIGSDYAILFADTGGRTELGYNALCVFCNRVGLSYRWLMILEAFLFIVPISYVLKKETKYPIISLLLLVLLGFYFNSFNISRQMMAIAFIFLSLYYYSKNNNKNALIFFIFAFLMHTSALIAIFVYPLKYIKLNYKIWALIVIISLISSYFVNTFGVIENVLQSVGILGKYTYYLVSADTSLVSFQLFATIINLMFIYFLYRERNLNNIWGKVSVFGLIFSNIFMFAPGYFTRLFIYFNITQVVYISQIAAKKQQYSLIVLVYAFLYFCYYTLYLKLDGVIPYSICF